VPPNLLKITSEDFTGGAGYFKITCFFPLNSFHNQDDGNCIRAFLVLPGALLMALRGLSTLSTRRILRKPMPEPPNMEMRETETTTMSRQLKA
jgi:hypothetical protein